MLFLHEDRQTQHLPVKTGFGQRVLKLKKFKNPFHVILGGSSRSDIL